MKKIAILMLVAVSSLSYGKSPIRLGIKAGADISRLGISNSSIMTNDEQASFGLGFYGGGLLEVSGPAGSKFKGQIEALFVQHRFNNSYKMVADLLQIDQKTTVSKISVPVMLKYFLIPDLSINVGASVNFNLASKTDVERKTLNLSENASVDNKENDYLQPLQVGVLAGATYYIYKGFFVDARYNYYFGKALDTKTNTAVPAYNQLSAIQVGIGYKF